MPSHPPEIVFAYIGQVGYHAWLDADHVALWRQQDQSVLQLVELDTQEARTLATGVGRSPQSVPNRRAFSFTRATDVGTVIEAFDLDLNRTEALVFLPEGGWKSGVDLAHQGLRLSRLAVSPDGTRLALVAEPAQ